jgi:hypothetical protein
VLLLVVSACDTAPTAPARPSAGHDVAVTAPALHITGSYAIIQRVDRWETAVQVDIHPDGTARLGGGSTLIKNGQRIVLDSVWTATSWFRSGDTVFVHMPATSGSARDRDAAERFLLTPDALLDLDCFCDAAKDARFQRITAQ